MDNFIFNNLHLWRPLIYSVLFLGLLLEGEAILFTAVYLVHQGKLDPGDTIGIAICGVLIGDSLWYFGGPAISGLPVIKQIVARVPKDFDAFIGRRPRTSIIASKFIYGFHRPTLIRLKAVGVVYSNFLKADVPGALFWISVISSLGYLFSTSVSALKEYFKYWEIGLTVSLIIFFLISKLISKLILKKVTKRKIS